MITTQIAIIGAGLTGLTLKYLLDKKGIDVVVIEARPRLGGRILSTRFEHQPPVEMGATWLVPQQRQLLSLIDELGLEIFPQILGDSAIYEPFSTNPPQLVQLPENQEPNFRISGGTSSVIEKLAERIKADHIYLDSPVHTISKTGEHVLIETQNHTFLADTVASTLPPHLLISRVAFNPSLPKELTEVMRQTHTWMGESIKVGLVYKEPFWREKGLSGTIFSSVGPITEMYDHSDAHDSGFALKGFMNGSFHSVSKEERKELVLRQLRKYFGSQADDFIAYHESVWSNETFTYAPYESHVLPHMNNGHRLYQESFWEGNLIIGGSETSPNFPGYMEGAVRSAYEISKRIV